MKEGFSVYAYADQPRQLLQRTPRCLSCPLAVSVAKEAALRAPAVHRSERSTGRPWCFHKAWRSVNHRRSGGDDHGSAHRPHLILPFAGNLLPHIGPEFGIEGMKENGRP